jgi:hypothetical protein
MGGLVIVVMALTIAGCNSGCLAGKGQYNPSTGVYNTNEMADVLVVTAQNTRKIALDVFDGLMTIEAHNEETLKALSPGIHKAAEEVRRNGPKWLDELSAAIADYQKERSATNGDKLKAALKLVDDALLSASKHLAEATRKAKVP